MSDARNPFGVGANLGLTWMINPPQPGEPLERAEVLLLIAALSAAVNVTPEELAEALGIVAVGSARLASARASARERPELIETFRLQSALLDTIPEGTPSHIVMAALSVAVSHACDRCGVSGEKFGAAVDAIRSARATRAVT